MDNRTAVSVRQTPPPDLTDPLLRRIAPRLAEIETPQWRTAIRRARPIHCPGGTILHDRATRSGSCPLVLRGTLRVYQRAEDGREITLYRIGTGEICLIPLVALRTGHPFDAVVEAETEVHGLALPSHEFEAALNASPPLQRWVMKNICEAFLGLVSLVGDTAFQRLDVRLATLLNRRFEDTPSPVLRATHQKLANELGTSREMVSRTLKELERRHCIHLSRGSVHLRSAERLAEAAGTLHNAPLAPPSTP